MKRKKKVSGEGKREGRRRGNEEGERGQTGLSNGPNERDSLDDESGGGEAFGEIGEMGCGG